MKKWLRKKWEDGTILGVILGALGLTGVAHYLSVRYGENPRCPNCGKEMERIE